jgi:hypothetical protein
MLFPKVSRCPVVWACFALLSSTDDLAEQAARTSQSSMGIFVIPFVWVLARQFGMLTRGREVLWTVVMIIELKPEDELLVNNPLQSGPPSGIEDVHTELSI